MPTIQNTPSIASATAAANTGRGRTGATLGDFNVFLSLLTTQLRNQNPTEPMDTNRMTQELAMFASVEQQTLMNEQLERLVALQQAAQLTAAAPLMGRVVEVETDHLALQEGIAVLRLPPAGAAAEARITITDAAGRVLREQRLPLAAGQRSVWSWDGRDAQGRLLPDGAYRVRVEGATPEGQALGLLPFTVLGVATAAERQQDGVLRLMLGPLAVGFEKVRGIGDTLG
jgi:flagellar basal-body rod modification protein FlgD